MKRSLFPVVFLAVLVAVASHTRAADGGSSGGQPPMFPKITMMPLDGGEPVPITSYRGHPVLVNFWATWCPPCRAELPEIQKLYDEFAPKGLKVAAVNVNRSSSGVSQFVQGQHLTIPVFRLDERTLRRLGVSSIPMSVLIDDGGRVVRVYRGYSPTMVQDIERRLATLLVSQAKGASS